MGIFWKSRLTFDKKPTSLLSYRNAGDGTGRHSCVPTKGTDDNPCCGRGNRALMQGGKVTQPVGQPPDHGGSRGAQSGPFPGLQPVEMHKCTKTCPKRLIAEVLAVPGTPGGHSRLSIQLLVLAQVTISQSVSSSPASGSAGTAYSLLGILSPSLSLLLHSVSQNK